MLTQDPKEKNKRSHVSGTHAPHTQHHSKQTCEHDKHVRNVMGLGSTIAIHGALAYNSNPWWRSCLPHRGAPPLKENNHTASSFGASTAAGATTTSSFFAGASASGASGSRGAATAAAAATTAAEEAATTCISM